MKRIFVIFLSIGAIYSASHTAKAQALTDTALEIRSGSDVFTGTTSYSGDEDAPYPEEASSSHGVAGYLTAQGHRSTVDAFSDSLIQVADRDTSVLGAQLRHIAETQRDAEATTTEAIEKVAARSSLVAFLFGSDQRNLKLLKGELVRMQNHLAQLRTILSQTFDDMTRAVLETQIKALEKDQRNLVRFVSGHENSPSIFGWLTGIFS